MTDHRMPLLFLGHGSPTNAMEQNAWTAQWRALGEQLPRPKAILCLSAHFAGTGSHVVTVEAPETIHDFYGFPQEMYRLNYPAPGSPQLAQRVLELLPEAQPTAEWGLDHGAWSVLMHLYPQADIPVVQLSLDLGLPADRQMDIGRRLAPLRGEGVLLLGSGNVVHNLRRISPGREPFPWAVDFDEAVTGLVTSGDFAGVQRYMDLPGARDSVPTNEHFVPLLYILGAAQPGEKARAFCRDYVFASLSMTGFVLGE